MFDFSHPVLPENNLVVGAEWNKMSQWLRLSMFCALTAMKYNELIFLTVFGSSIKATVSRSQIFLCLLFRDHLRQMRWGKLSQQSSLHCTAAHFHCTTYSFSRILDITS